MDVVNKYYYPKPEEFRPGFEYQSFNRNHVCETHDGWSNEVVYGCTTLCTLSTRFFENLNVGAYRVKYLDKEDIESLGISVLHEVGDLYDFEYDLKLGDVYIGQFLEGFDPHVESNIELYGTHFRIKNKSELEVLLKQLGINE